MKKLKNLRTGVTNQEHIHKLRTLPDTNELLKQYKSQGRQYIHALDPHKILTVFFLARLR